MNRISDLESAQIFADIARDFLIKQLPEEGCEPKSYDEIVNMLLDTEYGSLVSNVSLECIGIVFGVTREGIRQTQNTAIKKLKEVINDEDFSRKIDEFDRLQQ